MEIANLLSLAKDKKHCPENVIARGAIIEFLTYDTEMKFFPSEIGNFFGMTKQNVYYSLKTIHEKYKDFAIFHKCQATVNANKDFIRNAIIN